MPTSRKVDAFCKKQNPPSHAQHASHFRLLCFLDPGCHGSGALGAPKVGANADWAPRLSKGLDGLLKAAVNGIRAMPAKGGVADATDAELARAIVYMANKSGGSLKEPK